MILIPQRLAGLGLAAVLALPIVPSDPMGVYCLVEKVVFEPAETPERAQIWGVCAVANEKDWFFQAPAKGYFYYSLPSSRAEVARAEWKDLKSVAGSNEVVGYGRRYRSVGRLRPATEQPASPDEYPVHLGVTKVSSGRFAPEVRDIVAKIRATRGE